MSTRDGFYEISDAITGCSAKRLNGRCRLSDGNLKRKAHPSRLGVRQEEIDEQPRCRQRLPQRPKRSALRTPLGFATAAASPNKEWSLINSGAKLKFRKGPRDLTKSTLAANVKTGMRCFCRCRAPVARRPGEYSGVPASI
jgi:hypothetical protein